MTPTRDDITFDEALRVAELQATKLIELLVPDDGIKESDIAGLPRIRVVYEPLSVSGMSHWSGTEWVIALNSNDSWARQRFTLLHEFKHIIDHGSTKRLYAGSSRATAAEQAERAADYFAGCALIPKRRLKAVWGQGIQRIADLAAHFGASEHAVRVRLDQTKLNASTDAQPPTRCARPVSTPWQRPQRFRTVQPRYARRTFA
ncbi:ImmA/IrrE family metallo-endopeptidase [Nocardioides glacieisoli]|uniref:ImmA/IrrE family metallo-endopeptidase n=1 Tax=Nocardioides glacieisoli TaxID=1168730 RepID=UPI0013EB3460|nr:ImmA/IrrE family metallo-endopeptidase [Nocardioides glacieisoli]